MAGKIKDIAGQIFGRLTVLQFVKVHKENAFWECKCTCGEIVVVSGSALRRTHRSTKSCGCLQREFASTITQHTDNRKLTLDELYLSVMRHHFKRGAIDRNLSYELSDDLLVFLTKSNCNYCNKLPYNTIGVSRKEMPRIIYQGIDRIDSSKGYIESNVVPCCKVCNFAKMALTTNDFLSHIEAIYKHSIESKK